MFAPKRREEEEVGGRTTGNGLSELVIAEESEPETALHQEHARRCLLASLEETT